jgi:hypothetical protein
MGKEAGRKKCSAQKMVNYSQRWAYATLIDTSAILQTYKSIA